MASMVYTERIPESKRWGGWLNYAARAGVITDAQVNANATVAGLIAAVDAAAVRTEQRPIVNYLRVALNRAVSMGQVPATHGVTTVAGLVALGDASTTFKQGFHG